MQSFIVDNELSNWFKETVGIRRGCIYTAVWIRDQRYTNLKFADDIDLVAESQDQLQELTE